MGASTRVLVVCTANRYRSPVAELLLQQACDAAGLDWVVRSAGTHAIDGENIHPHVAAGLSAKGVVPPAGWRSRRLVSEVIGSAELVLAAERAHRGQIVQANPAALDYAFTLRQFARLTRAAGPGWDCRRPAAVASGARAMVPGVPDDDDIADPAGRGRRALTRCIRDIEAVVRQIVDSATTG